MELVERITHFHNSAVRGDSDAVNQEARMEVNYSQSKSAKSQPRWTQTVITNSDENLEKVLQVYQDDPDATGVENSQRNKPRFLLRNKYSRSDTYKVFRDQVAILVKHGQLLIVQSIDVSANAKGKRLNGCSRMAQDIMSLAGGGYGLTDSFYNSGISNGPADCQKWSYCHSNERNSATIDDIVNTADLNSTDTIQT